jgi:hypothetical protein
VRKIHSWAIAASRQEPVIGPIDGQVSIAIERPCQDCRDAEDGIELIVGWTVKVIMVCGYLFEREKRTHVYCDGIVMGEFPPICSSTRTCLSR